MRVAIVVPALDEEEALAKNLPAALAAADEVIVSDGGSQDGTLAVARRLGARTVSGPPGRGGQLNRGAAAAAAADLLVFLHADTVLPEGGVELARAAVRAGAPGGGFLLRFDDDRPRFRFGAGFINRRTRWTRLPLGDQAQFATAQAFRRLGGFRDWPILEDLDFARRLKRLGRVAVVERPATTAARRFVERGALATVATNWLIWGLYFAGVPPHRLMRLYRHVR